MGFSPNILVDIQQILSFQFMQHAFEAGTMVAIIAGFTGYFVVIRRSTFVAHAFSEIGFSGAAGAVLVSSVTSIAVPPIAGLLLGSMLGGLAIGLLGRRATYRDVHIGIVLAFTLGLGLLFISLYPGYATETYSILFGEILGINSNDVYLTLISGLIILAAISLVYRPLLFSSLDEELAEAKGVPMLPLGIVFMMIVAVAVSISIQFTGVLLIFSLMVTPAATAQYLASTPRQVIAFSVLISLAATWLGLFVAFYEAPPVSFFITTFAFAFYLFVRFVYRRVRPMHPKTTPLQVPS
jgi:zinc/manganese transport system permease protein